MVPYDEGTCLLAYTACVLDTLSHQQPVEVVTHGVCDEIKCLKYLRKRIPASVGEKQYCVPLSVAEHCVNSGTRHRSNSNCRGALQVTVVTVTVGELGGIIYTFVVLP